MPRGNRKDDLVAIEGLERDAAMAAAHPDDPVSAFRAAICRSQAGDSLAAARWLARAAALPGASEEIRETARQAGLLGR